VAAIQGTITSLAPWLVATVVLLVGLGSFYDGLMAYLISYFRQRAWNLIALVGNLLQPLLTAALVLAGWGVAGVLAAMIVTPLISTVLAAWQVFRISDVGAAPQSKTQNPKSTIPWRRFFTYTTISNVLNLSDYLISSLFAVFLLNDLAQGAIYGVGTALVRQVLALLYAPLAGVQVPLLTRVRGGDGSLPVAYAGLGRILALVLLPGGVGLMLLAHGLILVQYPQFVDAALVVYLLTPCLFAESFLSTAQIALQVYERYRLLLLTRVAALAALPVLLWAAPRYGLLGAALAVGGGRLLMGLAGALLARRTFAVRHSWPFLGRVALAALVMAAVVGGMLVMIYTYVGGLGGAALRWDVGARVVGAVLLLAVAAAGALTFALALRLLGGLLPEDRQRIAQSRLPLKRWLLKIV
jgi:O-antigen/teichoic acid export membrane protein